MRLTRDDWIMVGAGKLFGAPFLSRVLLYRLHDMNYSILICHDRTNIVSKLDNIVVAGGAYGLSGIYAGNVAMATNVCESPIISIHFCSTSSSVAFEDLAKLPPTRITYEKCVSNVNHFGDVAFSIEPFSLVYSDKLFAAYPGLKTQRFNIADSNDTVTGPVSITDLPDVIPKGRMRRHCWRIRLTCIGAKTEYEVGNCSHWSLVALKIGEQGQLDTAVYLENKEAAYWP